MKTVAILIFTAIAIPGLIAQTPADPKTYSAAIAAGKAAAEQNDNPTAEANFKKAVSLAANDVQKADGLIALGGVLTKMSRTVSKQSGKYKARTEMVSRVDEAHDAYQSALKLSGVTDEKQAKVHLKLGDIYADQRARVTDFRTRLKSEYNKEPRQLARDQYAKVLGMKTVPADLRITALVQRSETYDTSMSFGKFNMGEVKAAFDDLRAAGEMKDGSHDMRAMAYLKLADLGWRLRDLDTYTGAYERITLLPRAQPAQKISAYFALASLFADNKRFPEARKYIADALLVKDASAADRAGIFRISAMTHILEMQAANANADVEKYKKLARDEMAKTVKSPGISKKDELKTLIANSEYIRNRQNKNAMFLAHEQAETALKLKGITDSDRAEAQYEIGEIHRVNGEPDSARRAYEKVLPANSTYFNYAKQRIQALSTPGL